MVSFGLLVFNHLKINIVGVFQRSSSPPPLFVSFVNEEQTVVNDARFSLTTCALLAPGAGMLGGPSRGSRLPHSVLPCVWLGRWPCHPLHTEEAASRVHEVLCFLIF